MKPLMQMSFIGIDFGATNIRLGVVMDLKLMNLVTKPLPDEPSVSAVLDLIEIMVKEANPGGRYQVRAMGIGVPSVVDIEQGMVYEVQNIPGWDTVPIKQLLEKRTGLPVFLNNDANCFAIGEKVFGAGLNYPSLVALILGTGFAGGIIINDKLYNGSNGGAGEFGMLPYKESIFEHYCSGQFFTRHKKQKGELLLQNADRGVEAARNIFKEFGHHLGEAIKTILYAYDPPLIILGGGVSQAYPLFEKAMWETISSFPYTRTAERLIIKVSDVKQIAVLGAAALCMEDQIPLLTNL